jgi:hypothetical protein
MVMGVVTLASVAIAPGVPPAAAVVPGVPPAPQAKPASGPGGAIANAVRGIASNLFGR